MEKGECRGEEVLVLVLAFLVPQDLHSGVRNSWGNYGRRRGDVGYTGAGEGGDNHVMV